MSYRKSLLSAAFVAAVSLCGADRAEAMPQGDKAGALRLTQKADAAAAHHGASYKKKKTTRKKAAKKKTAKKKAAKKAAGRRAQKKAARKPSDGPAPTPIPLVWQLAYKRILGLVGL